MVLLPQPLGPINTVDFPFGKSISVGFRTCNFPNDFETFSKLNMVDRRRFYGGYQPQPTLYWNALSIHHNAAIGSCGAAVSP
jgi:hypothetical protein